jgi:hypothetical protein
MKSRIAKSLAGALLAVVAIALTGCATDSYGFSEGTRSTVVYAPSYQRYWDHGRYYYRPIPPQYRGHPEYWRNEDRRDRHDDRGDYQRWNND